MYFARVLVNMHPHLRWKIPLGSKNVADYGQPVLEGFRNNVPLNPVSVADNGLGRIAWKTGSAQAAGIARCMVRLRREPRHAEASISAVTVGITPASATALVHIAAGYR
jgi:hypothetical protein